MTNSEQQPRSTELTAEQFDSYLHSLKMLFGGVVALVVIPLLIYGFFLEQRFHTLQDSLRYQPPQEFADEDSSSPVQEYQLASRPVSGQVVYVPAYSHVYHEDGDPYLLTITLSMRNTSQEHGILVKSVRYFDTKGQLVNTYLKKPVQLSPLGATEILVERDDATGGSGASFLVEWISTAPVNEPIIEAVMIDTNGQQGISFARRGIAIQELIPAAVAN